MRKQNRLVLDFAYGFLWAMVLAPAAAVQGYKGSQWLLIFPMILALSFFLAWLISQYRRMDVHAWENAHLTPKERQNWYKQVRLVATWLALQTLAIFLILGAIHGRLGLYGPLGAGLGIAAAVFLVATWFLTPPQMANEGWRW